MSRTVWVAAVAVTLVTSGLGFAQLGTDTDLVETAQAASDDAVLRYPNAGDQARFKSTYTDATALESTSVEYTEEWTLREFRLPTGQTRDLPAQVTTYADQDDETSGSAAETTPTQALTDTPLPTFLTQLAPGASEIPGALQDAQAKNGNQASGHDSSSRVLAYESASGYTSFDDGAEVYAYTFGHKSTSTFSGSTDTTRYWTNTSYLTEDPGTPCQGPTESLLFGQSPEEADATLRSCLEEEIEDDENLTLERFETRWEDDERFGDVWVVDTTLRRVQNVTDVTATTTLHATPEASMIVYQESHTEGTIEGERVDTTWTLELEGWTSGSSPLDPDIEPLSSMPTVATTAWGTNGPSQGDLAQFPFSAAKANFEDTDEGSEYFANAEDPWVFTASFTTQPRDTNDAFGYTSGTYTVNSVRCDGDSPTPSTELPEQADKQTWSIYWDSEEAGSLYGYSEEPQVARENPSGQTLPLDQTQAFHDEDGAFGGHALVAPTTGPQPQALWEKRDLTDAFQDRGAYVAAFDAFLFAGSANEDRHMDGDITRAWCQKSAQGDGFEYEATTITFDNATADRVASTHIMNHEEGNGDAIPQDAGTPTLEQRLPTRAG